MKSIGLRLAVIMVCVILLGIAVTAGVSVVISGGVITQETLTMVRSETDRQMLLMDEWLSVHLATVSTLAVTAAELENPSETQLLAICKASLDRNKVYQDIYVGFPDDTAVMGSGFPIWELYDWWKATQRGWYKLALTEPSRAHITSPYVDSNTGELCITAVRAVVRGGAVVGVVGIDILVTELQKITLDATLDANGYAMLLDVNGDILVHQNGDYAPYQDAGGEFQYRNLATVKDSAYAGLWRSMSGSDDSIKYKDAEGLTKYYTAATLATTGWRFVTILPANIVTRPITNVVLIVIPITLAILLFAVLLIYLFIRKIIVRPIAGLVDNADALAAGDTGIRVDSRYQGEMGTLAQAFQRMADSIDGQVRSAKAIADGDLTESISVRSERDVMGLALKDLLGNLRVMVSDISEVAGRVAEESKRVVSDSEGIAHDTEDEVRSMERLSESAETLSEDIQTNAELAKKAEDLSGKVKESAEKGNLQMEQMLLAVKDINDASRSIEKVMKAIEDIAFQTNILALNAAVEAARAGQHGKGFAVVAEEVRNLASKSAAAAKDTSGLITDSMEKAALGARIAGDTSASLRGIVDGIIENTEIVGKIALSGAHQSRSVAEINKGISKMLAIVQHSSRSVRESTEASEEMRSQANVLEDLIAQFKLEESGPRAISAPPR